MATKCRGQPTADRLASGNSAEDRQPDEFPEDNLQALPPQDSDSGDARLYRDVERLHRLGPWPLYELLTGLACDRLIRLEIERLVARYAELDAAAASCLRATDSGSADYEPPP